MGANDHGDSTNNAHTAVLTLGYKLRSFLRLGGYSIKARSGLQNHRPNNGQMQMYQRRDVGLTWRTDLVTVLDGTRDRV